MAPARKQISESNHSASGPCSRLSVFRQPRSCLHALERAQIGVRMTERAWQGGSVETTPTERSLEGVSMTDTDGKRVRPRATTLDSHPVEDEVDVLEIVVKREAGLKLICADKPHHLLVVLQESLIVKTFCPSLHSYRLYRVISLLA